MASSKAVNNIDNLLISSTENGIQESKSLLDSYKLLNRILKESGISSGYFVRWAFNTF